MKNDRLHEKGGRKIIAIKISLDCLGVYVVNPITTKLVIAPIT